MSKILFLAILTASLQSSLLTAQAGINRLTYLGQDSATAQYWWEAMNARRLARGLPLSYENRSDTMVVFDGPKATILVIDSTTYKNTALRFRDTLVATFNTRHLCFGGPDEDFHHFYDLAAKTISGIREQPPGNYQVTYQTDFQKHYLRDTAQAYNVKIELENRCTIAGLEGYWVSFERQVNYDTEITQMYLATQVDVPTHLIHRCPRAWRGAPLYVEVFSKKTPRNKHFLILLKAEQLPAEEADAYLNKYYQFTQKK